MNFYNLFNHEYLFNIIIKSYSTDCSLFLSTLFS